MQPYAEERTRFLRSLCEPWPRRNAAKNAKKQEQVTAQPALNTMGPMNKYLIGATVLVAMFASMVPVFAQKDKDDESTSWLYFAVIKDDNGKPVRNAAVILHPVNAKGKQERGDLELKTDPDGKCNLDGIPYGTLRVQVLAHGFQTYGEDFDIEKPKTDITIKLKKPQQQYSIYDDHPDSANPAPKQDTTPSDQKDKKPN
jgi:hypothetical protein